MVFVSAFAGTDKTATLRMFAEARPQYRILYLAFNRAIAKEANDKFRDLQNVEARTIHSLAFKHIGYAYKSRLGNIRPYELQKKGVVSNYINEFDFFNNPDIQFQVPTDKSPEYIRKGSV